tara:strand:- start:71 stop:1066 length:996 start_codon:yes stop_codon:yes gene_type:complete
MGDNQEKDSIQDALIIATAGGPAIWIVIGYAFSKLNISFSTLSQWIFFVLAWIFVYSICRVITRQEPENFQLQTHEGSCPNCGTGIHYGVCEECIPSSVGAPDHFTKETKRKFTFVSYSMISVIMYFGFFNAGHDLFLWDQFPDINKNVDILVNIVVSSAMFIIYIGMTYLMLVVVTMVFVNPTNDEIHAASTENYAEYKEYYFGKLNQNGKVSYLKQYNRKYLDWGWVTLSKHLRNLFTLAVINWVYWGVTLALIFLIDLDSFEGRVFEFLSNETLGTFTYYLSLLILILVVPISRYSSEEYSKECVYQRVSHKFFDEIVDELNQTVSDE